MRVRGLNQKHPSVYATALKTDALERLVVWS